MLRGARRGERISGTWSRSRTGTVGTASTWRGTTLARSGNTAADRSGTYALDGYMIELRHDSGKVDRRLFALSSDGKHVFARLGGEIMTRE